MTKRSCRVAARSRRAVIATTFGRSIASSTRRSSRSSDASFVVVPPGVLFAHDASNCAMQRPSCRAMGAAATASDTGAARGTRAGHLALLAVQVVFGLFPVFVKLAVAGGLEPKALAVWRIAFGTLSVGAVAFALHGRDAIPQRRHFPRLFVCALLGVIANQVLALEGTSRTSAASAGLLMTLIPVFTFAIAALTRQERFAPRQLLGVPIALAGALYLLLAAKGGASAGSDPVTGNALIVANTLAYAGYLVLSRRVLREIPPAAFLFWVYALSLWAVPWLAHGHELLPTATDPKLRADGWTGLVLLLVGPTFLAYLLNTFALTRVPASVTAIYIYLQPSIAAAGAALWLGEEIPRELFVSAAIVFCGIALVTVGRKRATRAR
ncbi:MAG: DMT family transporter [Planctomycetota bacterium]